MDTDFDAVICNENKLLDPGVRSDGAAVRALLHAEFSEFGSSGTVWNRDSIPLATTATAAEPLVAEDLRPSRLGPDAVLLTYVARRGTAASLRTSVWIREGGSWLMLHHQGTPLP